MITKEIVIQNQAGLTARAAATFVQNTNRYSSDISICLPGGTIDAKSIMCIISLGLKKGDTITLSCDGIDEQKAMDELTQLLIQDKSI